MKKHLAIVLLKTENLTQQTHSFEETLLSVVAKNEQEARKKADAYGQKMQTDFQYRAGDWLTVRFLKTRDVNEWLRPETGDVTEIYARHFTDWEAYSRFDILAGLLTEQGYFHSIH